MNCSYYTYIHNLGCKLNKPTGAILAVQVSSSPCARTLTHSLPPSLTHSLSHSLTRSPTPSLPHSPTHSLTRRTHPSTLSLTHSPTHPLPHSLTHLFTTPYLPHFTHLPLPHLPPHYTCFGSTLTNKISARLNWNCPKCWLEGVNCRSTAYIFVIVSWYAAKYCCLKDCCARCTIRI